MTTTDDNRSISSTIS